MGSGMFVTALRLALPAVALLLLTDLLFTVISRLQAQMQLLMLAFPAKISLSLFFLSAIMVRWPTIYEQTASALLNRVLRRSCPSGGVPSCRTRARKPSSRLSTGSSKLARKVSSRSVKT